MFDLERFRGENNPENSLLKVEHFSFFSFADGLLGAIFQSEKRDAVFLFFTHKRKTVKYKRGKTRKKWKKLLKIFMFLKSTVVTPNKATLNFLEIGSNKAIF